MLIRLGHPSISYFSPNSDGGEWNHLVITGFGAVLMASNYTSLRFLIDKYSWIRTWSNDCWFQCCFICHICSAGNTRGSVFSASQTVPAPDCRNLTGNGLMDELLYPCQFMLQIYSLQFATRKLKPIIKQIILWGLSQWYKYSFLGRITTSCLTWILTSTRSVSVRKGEQGCFINNAGWARVS